jgi:hypothetical protein
MQRSRALPAEGKALWRLTAKGNAMNNAMNYALNRWLTTWVTPSLRMLTP